MAENQNAVNLLRVKLAMSLGKARLEFGDLEKDCRDQEGNQYLSYSKLTKAVNKALANNGLSYIQSVDGQTVISILIHQDGGELSCSTECPIIGGREGGLGVLQNQTAKISYIKRIHLMTLLGVLGEDVDQPEEEILLPSVVDRMIEANKVYKRVPEEDHPPVELPTEALLNVQTVESVGVLTVAPEPQDQDKPEAMVSDSMVSVINSIMIQKGLDDSDVKMSYGCGLQDLTESQASDYIKRLSEMVV